jgi:hypothetical protein
MSKPSTFFGSLILTLGLAACGGGGDNAAVVPASYLPGSAELGAWNVLSNARNVCGFDGTDPLVKLTRNIQLDAAALNHSKYLVYLSFNTGTSVLSHDETLGLRGFTGENAGVRAVAQGYKYLALAEILSATLWDYSTQPSFPTMQERGTSAMRGLLNTVYHLSGAMNDGADVGLGAYMETHPLTATTWREEFRFGALNGYDNTTRRIKLEAGTVVTYPCAGSGDVPTAFFPATESPNPFPTMTLPTDKVGPPIYLKVDAGQVLKVTSSSVSLNSVPVSTTMLTATNDAYIDTNEVFVVPNAALLPNTDYQIVLSGTVDNTPFSRSFTMHTGPAEI